MYAKGAYNAASPNPGLSLLSPQKFGWQHFGSCNEAELNGLMLRTFLIRRSKAEVLSDLPPKTRQTVRIGVDSPFFRLALGHKHYV